MTHDDSDIERLLAAARQADLPDAARLARVRARLPQPSAAGGSGAQTPAALRGLAAKIAAALLVVGAGAFIYRQTSVPKAAEPAAVERQPAAPPIATPDALPATAPPDSPPVAIAPPPEPSVARPAKHKLKPRAHVASPPSEVVKPAPPPVSTLNEEASLLRLATLAARACRLDEAQASLVKLAERYPDSQLNAERDRLSLSIRELGRTGRCKP